MGAKVFTARQERRVGDGWRVKIFIFLSIQQKMFGIGRRMERRLVEFFVGIIVEIEHIARVFFESIDTYMVKELKCEN